MTTPANLSLSTKQVMIGAIALSSLLVVAGIVTLLISRADLTQFSYMHTLGTIEGSVWLVAGGAGTIAMLVMWYLYPSKEPSPLPEVAVVQPSPVMAPVKATVQTAVPASLAVYQAIARVPTPPPPPSSAPFEMPTTASHVMLSKADGRRALALPIPKRRSPALHPIPTAAPAAAPVVPSFVGGRGRERTRFVDPPPGRLRSNSQPPPEDFVGEVNECVLGYRKGVFDRLAAKITSDRLGLIKDNKVLTKLVKMLCHYAPQMLKQLSEADCDRLGKLNIEEQNILFLERKKP